MPLGARHAIALALALGAVLAAVALWPRAPGDPVEACARERDDAARAECLAPEFERAALAPGGPAALLGRLAELSRAGTLTDCHMLAHHFGHVAYPIVGDLARTYRSGSGVCRYGYFHGAMEAAIGARDPDAHLHHHDGAPAQAPPPLDVAAVCVPLEDDGDLHAQCAHSLGHGLMLRLREDAPAALAECGRLSHEDESYHVGWSDFERCMNGVFMENVMRHLELDDAAFRAAAARACVDLALPDWQLAACHERIGEVAMYRAGHDLATARAVCASVADATGRAACEKGAADELASRDADRAGAFA